MPWKECSVMDERVRFVARLLEGEKMTALCREFAISRKTGYKIFDRYKESGLEALTDRSRRPWRYGNQLPQQVEATILNLKREKPYWGARKIRERLLRRFSCEVKVPARSEEHTSELQSPYDLVCRLLLEIDRRPPTSTLFPYTTLFRSQGIRSGSSDRPFAQALALRQPTAPAGGGHHPQPQTGETLLGRTQDPRTLAASLFL